jgi:hypothetical protein
LWRGALLALLLLLAGCGPENSPPHASAATVPEPATTAATAAAAVCHMRGDLPDPTCTPGVADPRVTQDNLATTICVAGYTKLVRPPLAYTDRLKREGMTAYGFTDGISAHEEDHLIPLELGGDPSDPRNLWPQPGRSPNAKDAIENRLHQLVCAGQVPLARAQTAMAMDWTTALQVASG